MFSRKYMKKKGGRAGVLSGNRQIFTEYHKQIFQIKIFSLRDLICKRMCSIRECIACPLFSQKGSLTVETALILPLFLLASLTLLSFIDVMKMSIEQQMRQQEILRNGAVYANHIGEVTAEREGDFIKLDYVYPVKLPIGGFGYKKVLVRQRSMVHIFNGYDDSQGDRVGKQQEYVYMTEYGSVYHIKRNCSSLNVEIKEIPGNKVSIARNTDGKKYNKCHSCAREYTKKELKALSLYITDYGVKYHTRINCAELTRTVRVVRIEDTGGKPACRICG